MTTVNKPCYGTSGHVLLSHCNHSVSSLPNEANKDYLYVSFQPQMAWQNLAKENYQRHKINVKWQKSFSKSQTHMILVSSVPDAVWFLCCFSCGYTFSYLTLRQPLETQASFLFSYYLFHCYCFSAILKKSRLIKTPHNWKVLKHYSS